MMGIFIQLLLPVLVLQLVFLLPAFLLAPLYLAQDLISQSMGEIAVSLIGLVGLLYYLMRVE